MRSLPDHVTVAGSSIISRMTCLSSNANQNCARVFTRDRQIFSRPQCRPAASRVLSRMSQDRRPPPTPRNLSPFRGGQAPHEVLIRAYALGYTAQAVPACVRVLLSALRHRQPVDTLIRQLARALVRGLRTRSLASAFGTAVGGARLLEVLFEPLCERWLASRDGYEGDSIESGKRRRRTRAACTYLSASVASLVAILLLQSKRPSARQTSDAIEFVVTPYSPLSAAAVDQATASAKRDSPTLDLTLLVFVRAGT